ncbi:MAG: four helix bundle protein [Candidatus Omnitrophota bacterium]
MVQNIRNFFDLDAWKKAHDFILEVYQITERFPRQELYGITSQIRRAASSISANIAEGFSRYHFNDKIRFYHNARGSVSETQNFLFLSKDLSFLNNTEFQKLFELSEETNKLINGLIRSIENQK